MDGENLLQKIKRLKQERNAIILAHSYQRLEIQDIADFVRDSLALARHAQAAQCSTIVFCGVRFMAEMACILNPDRTVLLPDMEANCSLEASCPADELARFLEENKANNYYVVAYISCSAQVKALADVIVMSGNARRIVESAPSDRPILFVPDQNLGAWVARSTGREMTLWNGACHVHQQFTRDQVFALKAEHPAAEIVCHPECTEVVRLLADHICSTEKMIAYCRESSASSFIIVTESGILHRLRKLVPGREFIGYNAPQCSCAERSCMKLNTLQKVRDCLLHMSPRVTVPEPLRVKAAAPLLRMLEISATAGK